MFFEVDVHRYYCYKCKETSFEQLPFLPHPKSRITRAFARTLLELRPRMSISDISEHYNVDWHVIKNLEKSHLSKKYKTVRLKDVEVIGLDELHISTKNGKQEYITVVRDLNFGTVLHVGEGKDSEALKKFTVRLKRSKCKVKAIAMDMSKAFRSWAKENLPEAEIVFDHFHVIKLMNEKVDNVRRRTYSKLDKEQKKQLKSTRFLFLKNVENLDLNSKNRLDHLRNIFKELGDVSMKKEELRAIYANASSDFEAEALLKEWCATAKETTVNELHKMAKTIENHLDGILAFWKNNRLTNAKMEGFNNKIRWLIRQAYGYKDRKYFYLKIYDLPITKTQRAI